MKYKKPLWRRWRRALLNFFCKRECCSCFVRFPEKSIVWRPSPAAYPLPDYPLCPYCDQNILDPNRNEKYGIRDSLNKAFASSGCLGHKIHLDYYNEIDALCSELKQEMRKRYPELMNAADQQYRLDFRKKLVKVTT